MARALEAQAAGVRELDRRLEAIERRPPTSTTGLGASPPSQGRAELPAPFPAGRPESPGDAVPSPDEVAAFDEAGRIIERAVSAKRWTDGDGKQLRRLLPRMAQVHRDKVLEKLALTINQRSVAVETKGPPF